MEYVACLKAHSAGATIALRVQPRSTRTGPLGLLGDGSLKWGVNAAPVDGRANEELIRALADYFEHPRAAISILKGESGRNKVALFSGAEMQTLAERLARHLS